MAKRVKTNYDRGYVNAMDMADEDKMAKLNDRYQTLIS